MAPLRLCALAACIAGGAAHPSDCAGRKDGIYCMGLSLAPAFSLGRTLLRCPGGQHEACAAGQYCGKEGVTGAAAGEAQCRMLPGSSAPAALDAPTGAKMVAWPAGEGLHGSPLCSPCVQLGGQAISALVDYILHAGVVGECSELCSIIPSASGQTLCNLVCRTVGADAFIKALNSTDLDPFYFCEEVEACPAGPDDAYINVLRVDAQPQSISKGQNVQLSVALDVVNASGVGEFGITVEGPVTQGISQKFILAEGIPKGSQQLGVKLTVQDDESGETPVVWSAGTYTVKFEVCQGECGSKHPHSKVFGKQEGHFTLTEEQPVIAI